MGSGTSLIEAQRLGRNSIGIELQEEVCKDVALRISAEKTGDCKTKIIQGDSRNICLDDVFTEMNIKNVQFVIMHPPYWDIVKFSNDDKDLSNAPTLDEFLNSFGEVIDNTTKYLERNRYCAVVIGDKYANGQIVPLGFYCMNLFLERGFLLKAILVKNFEETRGKSNVRALWRYRALASDFYIFKHEYIFVFKKTKSK